MNQSDQHSYGVIAIREFLSACQHSFFVYFDKVRTCWAPTFLPGDGICRGCASILYT
ncbi:MAG: hypothetical protein FWD57_00185 [Polyangiaceae bacterium]|nr:hypothetical protein [Polyangiaceae bacterium]